MLISWSRYSGTAGMADGPRALTTYMDAAVVMKRLANDRKHTIRRSPEPEILLGDAGLLRMAIRSTTCLHRYSSCVMSFAAGDIAVDAFNEGDAEARFGADQALSLWIETTLAGVPNALRPPVYVTTHTHTGALEINLAVPRWIRGPDGRYRGFNPAPPERGNATWDAARDVLNHRFGWADPGDPAKSRRISLPDWMLKTEAESHRAGTDPQQSTRHTVARDVLAGVTAGIIRDRASLLTWLAVRSTDTGLHVLGTTATSVTIGAIDAPPAARLRLKGAVFAADFGNGSGAETAEALVQAGDGRARFLATAADRLQDLWDRRAAFNRSRFGLGQWPPQEFSAAEFLKAQPEDRPLTIPRKHHLNSLMKGPDSHDLEIDTDGARLARYARSDDHGGPSARHSPERADRQFDSAAAAAREIGSSLAELAETLSRQTLIGQLTTRITRLVAVIRSRMTFRNMERAITPDFLSTLKETRLILEDYNGPTTPTTTMVDADRSEADTAVGPHLAAARASGGQLRGDGGPLRGRHRSLGRNRLRPPEDGVRVEGGAGEAVGTTGSSTAGDRENSGSADRPASGSPRLVRASAVPGSRGWLVGYLRGLVYAADPGARVSVQLMGDLVDWPPELTVHVAHEGHAKPSAPHVQKSTCRLVCAPALVLEILPQLAAAVKAGWVSGVRVQVGDLGVAPDNTRPSSEPGIGELSCEVERKERLPEVDDVAESYDR